MIHFWFYSENVFPKLCEFFNSRIATEIFVIQPDQNKHLIQYVKIQKKVYSEKVTLIASMEIYYERSGPRSLKGRTCIKMSRKNLLLAIEVIDVKHLYTYTQYFSVIVQLFSLFRTLCACSIVAQGLFLCT